MKTLKSFAKFIRKQKILIRITAVFKFIFIFVTITLWYGIDVLGIKRDTTPVDTVLSIVVPYLIFFNPTEILNTSVGILAIFTEILLLICFWNKNENT